jgi:hypothetical protein
MSFALPAGQARRAGVQKAPKLPVRQVPEAGAAGAAEAAEAAERPGPAERVATAG